MNTFACASTAVQTAPEGTRVLDPAKAFPGRLSHLHQSGRDDAAMAASVGDDIQVNPISENFELLVADIASLARSHMNLGGIHLTPAMLHLSQAPLQDGWESRHRAEPKVSTPSDVGGTSAAGVCSAENALARVQAIS